MNVEAFMIQAGIRGFNAAASTLFPPHPLILVYNNTYTNFVDGGISMITLVELTCEQCGTTFSRRKTEHTRNIRKGRRVFCSKNCTGKVTIANIPEDKRNTYDISQHSDNGRDEYTLFRYHMKKIKQHAKKRSGTSSVVEITLQDLKIQWEKQGGVCPYTGWLLITKVHPGRGQSTQKVANIASVDRIDSSKGYIVGNIQFVAFIANVAKHDFHEDELIKFCKAVAAHKID